METVVAATELPDPPPAPTVEDPASLKPVSGSTKPGESGVFVTILPSDSLEAAAAKAGSVAISKAVNDHDATGLRGALQEFPGAVNYPFEQSAPRPDRPGQDSTLFAPPLNTAAMQGHLDVMEVILQHGADPNAVDSYGGFPLQYSAGSGHAEGCRLLLRYGADPALENKQLLFKRKPVTAARIGDGRLPASLVEELEGTTRSCEHCSTTFPAHPLPLAAGRCVKCRASFFCSRGCLKQAWPLHKKVCKLVAAGPAAFPA